ncbi:GNAT family N-acetyltransferase [Pelagibius sp.]|uniref:GNAT family N-acetyltransferase n=1 Tax=Pelagibius sp. TaxID=1931238 RepID=UPI003B508099
MQSGDTAKGALPQPSRADLDIRWAKAEEARAIARLFLISSDGLATYIWSRIDVPDLNPEEVDLEEIGAARYARSGTAFSYENCLLALAGGIVVGMAHAFPMDADPGPVGEEDPVLRPYAELEDPGSLYLSGLAVEEGYRSAGIGAELMDCVEELARAKSLPRVSLICFERNTGALAFYRRRGYREIARRPLVPHPSLHYADGDALLLVRNC